MDFPKKQAQRLMPLYLLEYSEKLFENHPNPEAPWGGGGSDYTAGDGIDITNDVISVDDTVVAMKTDLSDYAKLNDDTQNITANSVTVTPGGGYIHTTYGPNTIAMSIPRTPGYTITIPTKDGTMALTSDIPSLTNYVTTTQLEDALDDYALKTDIPENVSDLNNDAGYTTQTWVENQGYLTSAALSDYVTLDTAQTITGAKTFQHALTVENTLYGTSTTYTGGGRFVYNYNNQGTIERTLFDLPTSKTAGTEGQPTQYTIATLDDIPTVNNPTITFTQGGVTKGSITLNQSSNQTIALDAGVSGNLPFLNVEDPNSQMYFSLDGSSGSYYRYVDLSASNRVFYVNLSALNPVFKNGLTSTYNTQTNELEVELNAVIPTKTSDLTNDSGFITSSAITNDLISVDLGIIGTSGTLSNDLYNALTANPEKTIAYTNSYAGSNKVQLFYKSGTASDLYYSGMSVMSVSPGEPYKWTHYVLRIGLATSELGEKHYTLDNVDTGVALKQNLATVATSGSYNDLTNKPTIPDAVSGTNDGTNWTTLTIGNSTYDIPQGGSAPGMIGEVLYDVPNGQAGVNPITMAHSFADYSYVDIQYRNYDNAYEVKCVRVYDPNGKHVYLDWDVLNNGTVYAKKSIYILSGNTMTVKTNSDMQAWYSNNSTVGTQVTATSAYQHQIKITKVIGYKANSSALTTETWTFTLQDGTTITKNIVTA